MTNRAHEHDALDRDMDVFISRMSPAKRLEVVDRLTRGVRQMVCAGVRRRHPEWSEVEVRREAARRMFDGDQ